MLNHQEGQQRIVSFFAKFSFRRFARYLLIFTATFILFILTVDQSIAFYVRENIYTNPDEIPHRPYGVVLGTSKYVVNKGLNPFYDNRLKSAKQLFDNHKINYLLLSGDNRTHQYNEPRTMIRDLKKMGIEEQFLFPDYAGFRTLDSIIRAKEVFHAEPMTIITQRFHCERALFIAQYYNINAICFAAPDPEVYTMVRLRDVFARFLMLWELFIEKEPHFLGNPEPLLTPTEAAV